MSYLFPAAMYERAERIAKDFPGFDEEGTSLDLMKLKPQLAVYQAAVHQYFNLGYLLSFVPKTNAYKARKNVSADLQKISSQICAETKSRNSLLKLSHLNELAVWANFLGRTGDFTENLFYFRNKSDRAQLKHYLNLSVMWDIFGDLKNSLFLSKLGYTHKAKVGYKEIFVELPIVKDFFRIDFDFDSQTNKTYFRGFGAVTTGLFQSLLNPFRGILQFLTATQHFHFRALETGAKKRQRSSWWRTVLKTGVTLQIGAIKAPVIVQEKVANIPFQTLKLFVYKPAKAAVSQLQGLWKNRFKRVMFKQAGEIRGAAQLKQAAISGSTKDVKAELDQHVVSLGYKKEEIVCAEENRIADDAFVALRLPRKEKNKMAKLIKIFKQPDSDEAKLEKAKKVVRIEEASLVQGESSGVATSFIL